ncbi:MAG: hypothetical protein IKX59_10325 [Bacteroidales bacterium]|nr:hypothetical protein [Bacteroidales bacterium]
MKEKIDQIVLSIEEKRSRLKEKADRYFATIEIPSEDASQSSKQKKNEEHVPPISFVLYGIAGLSTLAAFSTDDYKVLYLCIAAASAFGGYKLSKTGGVSTHSSSSKTFVNLGSLKNVIISRVFDSVKKTTTEWESFMELKQKEIQSTISMSSFNEAKKDEMFSQTFVFEVIDISLSEFSSMMNSAISVSDIKQKLADYKSKLLSSIDAAADKQIAKYKSLCQ